MANADGKTFILFRSYYDAAKMIPDKGTQAEFLMAVLAYGFDAEEPDGLSPWAAAMYELVRPNLENSRRKQEKGKESAEKRWGAQGGKDGRPIGTQGKKDGYPIGTQEKTGSKAIAIKDKGLRIKDKGQGIKDTTPLKPPKGALSEAQEQAFEAFWAIYPKKKSKGQAKIAWGRLNPSGDVIAAIMDKLPKLKASHDWQKDGGQYIPYPATWLNAEGWEDEVTPTSAQPDQQNEQTFSFAAIAAQMEAEMEAGK